MAKALWDYAGQTMHAIGTQLTSNQAINKIDGPWSMLTAMPKAIGTGWKQVARERAAKNPGLRSHYNMDDFGYFDAAKSMFRNSQGKYEPARIGLAGGAIAGSYLMFRDDY